MPKLLSWAGLGGDRGVPGDGGVLGSRRGCCWLSPCLGIGSGSRVRCGGVSGAGARLASGGRGRGPASSVGARGAPR